MHLKTNRQSKIQNLKVSTYIYLFSLKRAIKMAFGVLMIQLKFRNKFKSRIIKHNQINIFSFY